LSSEGQLYLCVDLQVDSHFVRIRNHVMSFSLICVGNKHRTTEGEIMMFCKNLIAVYPIQNKYEKLYTYPPNQLPIKDFKKATSYFIFSYSGQLLSCSSDDNHFSVFSDNVFSDVAICNSQSIFLPGKRCSLSTNHLNMNH
jgi:hypothetical protein